jgi:DNA-binding PadR family transcriptional regulator
MENLEAIMEGLTLELRRGTLVLSVLGTLSEKKYGYALVQDLKEVGLEIDQGTLYPLLRRLEKQGLLNSDWQLEESRPRRYYVISEQGKEILDRLKKEWHTITSTLNRIVGM